jgi:hypothetical protein
MDKVRMITFRACALFQQADNFLFPCAQFPHDDALRIIVLRAQKAVSFPAVAWRIHAVQWLYFIMGKIFSKKFPFRMFVSPKNERCDSRTGRRRQRRWLLENDKARPAIFPPRYRLH